MPDEILQSLAATRKSIEAHEDCPSVPGLYALSLGRFTQLKDFGGPGQIVYVGIAKKSLRDRDLRQHFTNRTTGRSTLRRSIGAILKIELGLVAIPRGGPTDSKRFRNFRFNDAGEAALTNWMLENLELGYWCAPPDFSYSSLRGNEYETIVRLHPTLDLDRRTCALNPMAHRLIELRGICEQEARLQT